MENLFPRCSGDIAPAYQTSMGAMYLGKAEEILGTYQDAWKKTVSLVLTSPPFPLNRKKRYGNLQGDEYLRWLASFSTPLKDLLRPDGSIVIELGNAWEPGKPVMSLLSLRALLAFVEAGDLFLNEEFVCYNPARLPSPAQWVTVERSRVKDAFTHIWWMAPSDRPKANNRNVLVPYSKSMEELLKKGTYNAGKRPSEHHISPDTFLRSNGGAIPSNVLIAANTASRDAYREYCAQHGLSVHPARMAEKVVDFFIRLLTEEGDVVLDLFAGSNTTGAIAEKLGRRWISIEADSDYVEGSKGRFPHSKVVASTL